MPANWALRLAFEPLLRTLVMKAMSAVQVDNFLFRFEIAETNFAAFGILTQVGTGLELAGLELDRRSRIGDFFILCLPPPISDANYNSSHSPGNPPSSQLDLHPEVLYIILHSLILLIQILHFCRNLPVLLSLVSCRSS